MPEPTVILQLSALGVFIGFLAGIFGIGGGMLSVPAVSYVLSTLGVNADLAVKMAIATSMATIVFMSLSNVFAQHRRGAVRWDLFRNMTPGIALGAFLTSLGLFRLIAGQWLAVSFGVFISYTALNMLRQRGTPVAKPMPDPVAQGAVGVAIGALAGLVGAGGAFIGIPFMHGRGVAIHHAIATSAALGIPVSICNALGFIYLGWHRTDLPPGAFGLIYLPALVILAIAGSLAAPMGVRVSHRLPVRTLSKLLAVVLFLLALYMILMGLTH